MPDTKQVDLLVPRYEVIGDYPHMERDQISVGDIISPYGQGFLFPDKVKGLYDTYPHLFKRLQWWEKRRVEEMPGFVKDQFGQIWNVGEWDMGGSGPKAYLLKISSYCHVEKLQPVTYAEYQSFISK